MTELSYKKGIWVLDKRYSREGIVVPKGFKTDLASIPRIFWSIYPPFGLYMNAAIVHDFLYKKHFPRKEADKLFLKIMKEDGVGWFTRTLFFLTVRTFGLLFYKRPL